ncbi:MAG: zeta toxin family protein [Alphaproteobacteria bacterium]|nr:zeta toxin family protein [Alphaproteobacteria bacterium]
MLFDEYKLSFEEHNTVLAEIRDFVFENKKPVFRPQVYILGGQPGAGKSVLTESILKNSDNDNIISINGDEFRLWHPRAREIFQKHGKMFAEYTDADFRTWTSAIFDEAIQNHYNMVFEGTMRTNQICNTIKQKLLPAGYQINILVVAVPEIKSRISIYSRYQEQLEKYPIARFTSRSSHDAAYQGMLDTLHKIENEHLYHTIKVYNRAGDILFQTGDKDIVSAIKKERQKPLSKEDMTFLTEQCDILLDKMRARNENEEYISDLEELKKLVTSQNNVQQKQTSQTQTIENFKNMAQSVREIRKPYIKPTIKEISGIEAKEILSLLQANQK